MNPSPDLFDRARRDIESHPDCSRRLTQIIATAVKRQHEPQQIIGDLLTAEISEKQARSIKYQMTITKLPLAEEVDFEAVKVNETLIHDFANDEVLDHQGNLVLIVCTGSG